MKTALVAGSTGLIGHQLLQLLLSSNRYDKIKALTRSEIGFSDPRLIQLKIDFSKMDDYKEDLIADDIFCCLGTTMAKAKTKEKFYQVDFSFPFQLAKTTSSQGAEQFLLVSALGADQNSSFYYNQVKGKLEEAVAKLPFRAIHIFRPSLLLGPRSERRSGEDAAKFFYKVFGFLIPEKYKAIHGEQVAKAMLYFAARKDTGIFVHESKELQHI